ncbi:MAG: T9SS type A sorting domain-containing protein, partial [Chitinophagales bacterium]|nr:T9SS type A sorting domain-containing protein [Chitinophagales bacterium]
TGSVTLKVSGGASATAASYSWTKDGVVLIGATSKKIIVSEAGSYAVSVTNTNGCTATSAAVEVVSSCKFGSEEMVETALNLYPNPAQGTFVVELNAQVPVGSTATVKVVNMLGQVVYANQIGMENNKLQAVVKLDGNVPAGNYLVSVTVGDKMHTGSIMYQK